MKALYSNTTGTGNAAFGLYAMELNTTGDDNSAFGWRALQSNTEGVENTAIGYDSLFANTTGSYNTASGYRALFSNTTGQYNTASGHQALYANTTGVHNTAVGAFALKSITEGESNTAVGTNALASNTTGDANVAIGSQALYDNGTGSNNTAVGLDAGRTNTGSNNIYFGKGAGSDHSSGSDSIFIGVNACNGITSASNFFCLGGASPMMYGNATRLVIERDVRINGDLYVTGSVIEGDNAGDDAWDTPDEVAGGASHDGPEPSNLSGFQVSGNTNQGNSSPTSGGSQDDSGEGGDGGFNPNASVRDSRDDPIYARNDTQEFSEDDMYLRDERDDPIYARNDDQDYREDDVDRHDDPDVPDDGNDNSDADPWDSGVDHQGDLYKPKNRARAMDSEEYALLDGKINELDFKYETLTGIVMETQERLREGFAMAAAIAARPTPNEYGFHFTAGAGNYDSVNALSMGFIYAHEDFTISVGHAKSDQGGPTMTNIGF